MIQTNKMRLKVLEICGIEKADCGRSCGIHICCGSSVVPKKKQMELVQRTETKSKDSVQARLCNNGIETCLVGFVSLPFVEIYGNSLDGRVAEVSDIHSQSVFEIERIRSNAMNGIARVTIIG